MFWGWELRLWNASKMIIFRDDKELKNPTSCNLREAFLVCDLSHNDGVTIKFNSQSFTRNFSISCLMRFEPESSRANKSKIFAFNTFNISSAAAPSSPKNRKQMKFFLIRTRRWFALLHLPSSSSWSKSKERHSHRAGERSHSTSATVKCAQTESSKRMQWNEARQHGKKKQKRREEGKKKDILKASD